MPRTEEHQGRSTRRLLAAFGLGGVAALSGSILGMPGQGEFVPAIWLAAFTAQLVAPAWPGFLALIAGVAGTAAVLDVSDGAFGLVVLVVAVTTALAAHGALSAWVVLRVRTLLRSGTGNRESVWIRPARRHARSVRGEGRGF